MKNNFKIIILLFFGLLILSQCSIPGPFRGENPNYSEMVGEWSNGNDLWVLNDDDSFIINKQSSTVTGTWSLDEDVLVLKSRQGVSKYTIQKVTNKRADLEYNGNLIVLTR